MKTFTDKEKSLEAQRNKILDMMRECMAHLDVWEEPYDIEELDNALDILLSCHRDVVYEDIEAEKQEALQKQLKIAEAYYQSTLDRMTWDQL
jgi:hypothetical protein